MRSTIEFIVIWVGCIYMTCLIVDVHEAFQAKLWQVLQFGWKDLCVSIAAVPLGLYLTVALDRLLKITEEQKEHVKERLLDRLLLTSVGFPEELFVRFALQQCFFPLFVRHWNWPDALRSPWLIAFMLGIAFGFGHIRLSIGGAKTVVKTAIKGVFYGFIVVGTGSLWAVIIAHSWNNGRLAFRKPLKQT
jgi:membrane protease YdiL (CAAX protease family)